MLLVVVVLVVAASGNSYSVFEERQGRRAVFLVEVGIFPAGSYRAPSPSAACAGVASFSSRDPDAVAMHVLAYRGG
jgi:hypothetical protein